MTEPAPHLSIVIPVYKSEGLLKDTVEELTATLEGSSFEVVLVDDGSPDQSWKAIEHLCESDDRVKGIRLYKNHGQHQAVMAGMSVAKGEWIVTMDDDGQNPPSEIKTLLDAADGHDVVFGRFRTKRAHGARRLGSRAVRWFNMKVFGMSEDFHVSNFRLIHREVAERILADQTAFPYVTGQSLIHSARPAWTDVDHRPRLDGRSNYTVSRIAALLFNILFAYSVWPLRVAAGLGFAVSLISLLAGATYLFMALAGRFQVEGWATVVVLVAMLGGVTIGMLAMLGEYVIRILIQSRGVASFTISERVGSDG